MITNTEYEYIKLKLNIFLKVHGFPNDRSLAKLVYKVATAEYIDCDGIIELSFYFKKYNNDV